jgi:hypothetical protein
LDENAAAGAGTDAHDCPAFSVRSSVRHRLEDEHGAVPSTHPCCVETKVTEAGTKPAGTATPTGSATAATEGIGEAVAEGVGEETTGCEPPDAVVVGAAELQAQRTTRARPATVAAGARKLREVMANNLPAGAPDGARVCPITTGSLPGS